MTSEGASNKVIAEGLITREKMVSNHIADIFSRLRVADGAQAVLRARDAGPLRDIDRQ